MPSAHSIEVQILNAFVDEGAGGNPAGVVLNADGLTNAQKLTIAGKVGLSETAFVSASQTADFKLDFFTPSRQIAHCGHATIATFSYLSQIGKVPGPHSSKETIEGRREILLQGDLAFMEQTAPAYTDLASRRESILESLGLTGADLLPGAPVLAVHTGNIFVLIPVADPEVLKGISPDFDAVAKISEELGAIGYYVFCLQTGNAGRDANARMFAPAYGIPEESGTGMAAGPLACYLHDQLGVHKQRLLIEQGWYMNDPSPSLIIVDLATEDGRITGLMAGGKGIVRNRLTVEY